ncbi:MAG: protein kinase, partial [Clostridiales bacterium]
DFGISKKIEGTISSSALKGTYMYIAPEIINGHKHDLTVDIYSLGIVLYRLLNQNRIPFMPKYPKEITQSDIREAVQKRFSEKYIEGPQYADDMLSQIILKACSFNPKYRYRSAMDFKKSLSNYLQNLKFNQRSKIVLNLRDNKK